MNVTLTSLHFLSIRSELVDAVAYTSIFTFYDSSSSRLIEVMNRPSRSVGSSRSTKIKRYGVFLRIARATELIADSSRNDSSHLKLRPFSKRGTRSEQLTSRHSGQVMATGAGAGLIGVSSSATGSAAGGYGSLGTSAASLCIQSIVMGAGFLSGGWLTAVVLIRPSVVSEDGSKFTAPKAETGTIKMKLHVASSFKKSIGHPSCRDRIRAIIRLTSHCCPASKILTSSSSRQRSSICRH